MLFIKKKKKEEKLFPFKINEESSKLVSAGPDIEACLSADEIDPEKLDKIMDDLDITNAWNGDFDEFMSNPNNHLTFD